MRPRTRRARAPVVGRFICIARRCCRVQFQAIVRWKARLTVLAVVLAVALHAAARASYGPVKLGLRHAVSAYRGGPWEQWSRAGATLMRFVSELIRKTPGKTQHPFA